MQATQLDDLPPWARAMLEESPVGRLGLVDEHGSPRVLPVTFVLSDGAFFTAVDEKRKSVAPAEVARVRYLREHPGAALTVDHYEDDWSTLAWAQVLGQAQVLDAGDDPSALEALRAKYEQYRRRPPPGPLIRLQPERFLCWRADD